MLAAETANGPGATTSFPDHDAGRQGDQEIQKPMPPETLPKDDRSRPTQPREAANRLAQINA